MEQMEYLTQHLQVVATRAEVAQFQQWLSTCMLYTQTGVTPTVEVYPYRSNAPLLNGIVWDEWHVWVPERALQKIPSRLLALLAVQGYMEATARRNLIPRSMVLTALVLLIVAPLIYKLSQPLAEDLHRWLFELLVLLPIHWVWAWWPRLGAEIDRQLVQQSGEGDALLEAMELAIKDDLARGVPNGVVNNLLKRLNSLREALGYPKLSQDDLLPPPPAEQDGRKEQVSFPIDKGEFLRRHPPDEYNQVDRVQL